MVAACVLQDRKSKRGGRNYRAPRGGRWFERGEDSSTCQWGSVLAWEPPDASVLSWDINADWQYDPELNTEIEVRFIDEGSKRTRVELSTAGSTVTALDVTKCVISTIPKAIGANSSKRSPASPRIGRKGDYMANIEQGTKSAVAKSS